MATIRLVPSTYAVSSSNYLSVSNASNMYTNTDSTNYATITNTNASTSSRYLYLRGFNFSDIPSGATINSFTVKIKGYESGLNTSTSYAPRLANGTSALSNTTASSNFGTSTTTITIPTGSLTWNQISNTYGSNFTIMVYVRRNNRNTTGYLYCYGAEIEVNYSAETVHVTGVDVSPATVSLEEGETESLTATVSPSNATDKSVSWSSSNTSVATVNSSGVVTAVSAGTATITATTTDGGYTDTCTVTVTAPAYTQYKIATSMEVGKSYLIVNGDSGFVYMLTNEANGSRTLKGVATTVNNGIISITSSVASRCLFECVRYTAGNDVTITVKKNNQYLYCDNANGLRMNAPATLDRFWHYRDNKFWQFKSTSSDGYSDASSEYKYYLNWTNGNVTDSHVDTTSIADSDIPLIYIFTEYTPTENALYLKSNGSWVEVVEAYKKVNGSWVLQSDLSSVFDSTTNYIKG